MTTEEALQSLFNPYLMIPIIMLAVIYGYFAGRARAARMRELRDDIKNGRPQGIAVVGVVVAVIVYTFMTRSG